jgi:Chitobiase/beta-hexosaminidase C-terminal domain
MVSIGSFLVRSRRARAQDGAGKTRRGRLGGWVAAVAAVGSLFCLTGCPWDPSPKPKTPAFPPEISPGSGSYTSVQSVTISDSTPGATIYFTQDGSTPTTASSVYIGPISVTKTETISAIATVNGYSASPVVSATYTLTLTAATPTFSPAAGSYSSPQSVTISDSSQGAKIYYTTDGTTPTTSSSVYSGPIAVNSSETLHAIASGGGNSTSDVASATYTIAGGKPIVTLLPPAADASTLSGYAYNVDPADKIVIYVLTNVWYVQPYVDAPFTDIESDGSWQSYTHPWDSIVVLLVDPANYTPQATEITNPALDPGVIAWTSYPSGPASVSFGGYTWGIKTTGNQPTDQFDPGPNFWSNDPTVVHVASDGLHLKINLIDGEWQCAEVYLPNSLGYGTYTVQIASPLDQLDQNTVAAPLFIYASTTQELDNEYSGANGLIPSPDNAQFVVQPYTVAGNIIRFVQPSTTQFTSQIEWRADHVTFTTWNSWTATPASSDVIKTWTYTGSYIPAVGQERVHINLWLLNGSAPVSGTGDEMIIHSFTYQP